MLLSFASQELQASAARSALVARREAVLSSNHRGAIKNVISVANFVSVLIGQNHSNFANLSVGV